MIFGKDTRGRKSHRRRCGPGDRGAAVLWPDQAIGGRVACAGPTALEDVADIVSPAQEATVVGRKKRNPGEVMGGHSIPDLAAQLPLGGSNALESTRLVNQSAATAGRWSCVDDQRTFVNQPL